METNNLQSIWKKIDSEISFKSKKELDYILQLRINKVMNKYLFFICVSILICVGYILFLLITAFNRGNDIIYQINNYFACLCTLISLISTIWSWNKLQNNKNNLPLKEWLEERISLLSKYLSSKLAYFIMPIFAITSILSIHVYYEYKPFLDVLKNEESICGLSFGLIIGGLIGYYAINKIRKYHFKNIERLKDLHSYLCNTTTDSAL